MSPTLPIRSARDVDAPALAEFYERTFPSRALSTMHSWLYRTFLPGNPLPLVMMDGSRVVGHAGGIPFEAQAGDRRIRAQWFVDFALLPEYRNRGLGRELTQAWMESAELCVTFCNEDSMRVFRRLGWSGRNDFDLHAVWLRPSAHPRLEDAPGILGSAANALARAMAAGAGDSDVELHALDEPGALQTLQNAMTADAAAARAEGEITAVRDDAYLRWRVEHSPAKATYRLYQRQDIAMLASLGPSEPRRLDVLWMPAVARSRPEIASGMLASLARWGREENFSLLRVMPPSRHVDAGRRTPRIVHRPQFACWTRNEELKRRLDTVEWRWQLIDSDFEWI